MLQRAVNGVRRPRLPYRVTDMDQPELPDDPGPPLAEPPSRTRRILTTAVLVALIASIVLLAFTSGRGLVTVAPVESPATHGGRRSDGRRRHGPPGHRRRRRPPDHDGPGRRVCPRARRAGGRLRLPGLVAGREPHRGPRAGGGCPDRRLRGRAGRRRDRGPGDGLRERGPSAVLPLLVPGRPAPDVPDDGARRPRAASRAGRRERRRERDPGRARRCTGRGPMPTACSSTAAAPTPARSSARPGRTACRSNRRPSSRATSALPASPTTAGSGRTSDRARAPRSRSSSRAATGPIRTRLDVFGGAAIDFGPTGSELAFIAPAQQGRAVNLPIGPLRLLDASTGDVRTILDGPVVAFYWAPNGRHHRGPPGGHAGRRQRGRCGRDRPCTRRRDARPGGTAGRGRARARPPPGVRGRRERRDPGAAIRPGGRRLRGAAAPLLRPVRAEPSGLVRRQPPHRASRGRPATGPRTSRSSPHDGSAAVTIAAGVAASWSP